MQSRSRFSFRSKEKKSEIKAQAPPAMMLEVGPCRKMGLAGQEGGGLAASEEERGRVPRCRRPNELLGTEQVHLAA